MIGNSSIFKVLYYPSDECSPLALAKSILVFDEIIFFDHPSITFERMGTVGHHSHMRGYQSMLSPEGYNLRVVEPYSGPVVDDLQLVIDEDLKNENFRSTFLQLVKNDPSFITDMVKERRNGAKFNLGYDTPDDLKAKVISIAESGKLPSSVAEINSLELGPYGFSPEMLISSYMALDSYKLNFASLMASEEGANLFGDSVGMDMLLSSKFVNEPEKQTQFSTSGLAFTLMDKLVPDKAFVGKDLLDVVRFRNEMFKEREAFKEHILSLTVDLQELDPSKQRQKYEQILYKQLIPEAREYQKKLANTWDTFFKESTKAIVANSSDITEIVVRMLPASVPLAILGGVALAGSSVAPHLIDYLKDKEAIKRDNPYAYLMKFSRFK